MSPYSYNYKFKFSRFIKTLAFQTLEISQSLWSKIPTIIPSLQYTATNGVIIIITNTASDFSTYTTLNKITISNTTNVTIVEFNSDEERDIAYAKILSAIHEFIKFIYNNGTLPHSCKYCFNFLNYIKINNKKQFCYWIVEVNPYWNIESDFCSNFGLFFDRGPQKEIFYL